MLENFGVEFHSHAYVHAVGKRAYAERFTYLLHPLAAAPTYRNYALIANIIFAFGGDFKFFADGFYRRNGRFKVKIDFFFEFVIQIFEYDVVFIRTQVANLRV